MESAGSAQLRTGKIPIKLLQSTVLRLTGAHRSWVVTPSKAGLDFSAVRIGRRFLVVSADPVTGVSKDIGRYAVKVSANDVATSGHKPQFAESVILLPEGSRSDDLMTVAQQIHEAAKESGISILGGHTEVSPGLRHPIVMITVFSLVDRFVTSGDAKDGDIMLMTKTAGLEGTSELAREFDFKPGTIANGTLSKARRLIDKLDISGEAVAAFRTGRAHAMHDCTEGGVLGAAFEMSLASGLGFSLDEKAIPIAPETRAICRALSIDPLRLIGSGSLLVAVERGSEGEVEKALYRHCKVTRIGEFRKGERSMILKDGSEQAVKDAPEDELWRVLSRSRSLRKRL